MCGCQLLICYVLHAVNCCIDRLFLTADTVCFCICILTMFQLLCYLFLLNCICICNEFCNSHILGNCDSVYCETCISIPADEKLRCQVCQSLHPNGIPKVCLELHHFLEIQFPTEYELRRNTIKQVDTQQEIPTIRKFQKKKVSTSCLEFNCLKWHLHHCY